MNRIKAWILEAIKDEEARRMAELEAEVYILAIALYVNAHYRACPHCDACLASDELHKEYCPMNKALELAYRIKPKGEFNEG